MKRRILLFLLLFIAIFTNAQTDEAEEALLTQTVDTIEGWKYGGVFSLNISQVSLNNWSAGGQSSVSVNGLMKLNASYKKGKGLFENFFEVGYGTMRQGKDEGWLKTDDKIDFTSKYGYQLSEKFYAAALVNFKTQMTDGYNYPDDSTKVSAFMAPGYFLGALGIDYIPNDKFSAFISPITTKYTIVLDDDLANFGAFGLPGAEYDDAGLLLKEGDRYRGEIGGYIRAAFKQELMKNVALDTKLELFSNYIDNPQYVDVNWEVLISMKVNEFLSASIATTLIWDKDVDILVGYDDAGDPIVDQKVQFKEVLQIGLTYSF